MFFASLPPHPPALVSPMDERAGGDGASPRLIIAGAWKSLSVQEALQNTDAMAEVCRTPYEASPPMVLQARTDTELVVEAVARLKDGLAGLTEVEVRSIREGLAIVEGRSTDPYTLSLARLYQIMPTSQATPELTSAPDAKAAFRAKYEGSLPAPVAGKEYPLESLALFAELQQILSKMPDLERAKRLRERGALVKFSPLTEKTLSVEAQGVPEEMALQARGELSQVVENIGARLDRLMQLPLQISPEQVLTLIFKEINSSFGVTAREQGYLLDGLVTHTFDCDIYAKVFCEVGTRYHLPIRALYIAGMEHKTGMGHCMPCIVLNERAGKRYFIFETRSAIEKLPDGTERRMYQSMQEIGERINKIAGRELIGQTDTPFIGTDDFILFQIPSRDPEERARVRARSLQQASSTAQDKADKVDPPAPHHHGP